MRSVYSIWQFEILSHKRQRPTREIPIWPSLGGPHQEKNTPTSDTRISSCLRRSYNLRRQLTGNRISWVQCDPDGRGNRQVSCACRSHYSAYPCQDRQHPAEPERVSSEIHGTQTMKKVQRQNSKQSRWPRRQWYLKATVKKKFWTLMKY